MLPQPELEAVIKESGFAIEDSERWEHQRAFDEWAAIVADPARTQPLAVIMQTLVDAGLDAGIGLRNTGNGIEFTHRWYFTIASVV
jgi:hypothetical protein